MIGTITGTFPKLALAAAMTLGAAVPAAAVPDPQTPAAAAPVAIGPALAATASGALRPAAPAPAGPGPILLAQNDATASDAPARTSVWVEEFDGFDLSEDWTVIGPNPDNYIVEDGALLAIASRQNSFDNAEAENLFQRLDDMPRGDWDVEMTFNADLQTGYDLIEFGLMKDAENFLAARYWTNIAYCSNSQFALQKTSRGESTSFQTATYSGCGDSSPQVMDETVNSLFESEGATLTLSKRGRSYYATLKINGLLDDAGNQIVHTTKRLTSLRSPGRLTLGISRWNAEGAGEILILVDRIELFEVE